MSYGKIAAASLLAVGLLSSQAFAAGDATKGKDVFKQCAICHNAENGGGNGVGPNLFGVVGRKSATVDGFNYSGPMKAANLTWTNENLAKWVAGPVKMVPGTKMAFGGISQKSKIDDLVAYLDTLK
jgi:cytochrome c